MAKWNDVFLIELSLISTILHFGCSAYTIQSEVCLERALEIALWDDACWFTLQEARDWLQTVFSENSCSKKCNATMKGLDESRKYKRYQLTNLALKIDGLMVNSRTRCSFGSEKKKLEIFCKTDCKDVNISDGLCTSPEECNDESKTCSRTGQIGFCTCKPGLIGFGDKCFEVGISNGLCTSPDDCKDESKTCSRTGQVGVCICKPGFIRFGDKCFEENLGLNEACQLNEQCSMVLGSICENNTCVCKDDYVSFNESECSLPLSVGITQASVQVQKEDSVVGVMVGAVLGGLILGIALTVFGFIIYNNIRNRNLEAKKKQDQKVAFFNNTSYETESDARQIHSTVQRTNERKIVNVPPFAHSMDLPVTENTHTNKSLMAKSNDVNNDVYNHLHEKEEDSDNDENYDHAHVSLNRTMEESDYSNLNTGRRYMPPGVSATEDNDYDERNQQGDYCSLEKQ